MHEHHAWERRERLVVFVGKPGGKTYSERPVIDGKAPLK